MDWAELPINGLVLILHHQGDAQRMTVRYDERQRRALLDLGFRIADAPGY